MTFECILEVSSHPPPSIHFLADIFSPGSSITSTLTFFVFFFFPDNSDGPKYKYLSKTSHDTKWSQGGNTPGASSIRIVTQTLTQIG